MTRSPGSNRIRCTKILEIICMAESKMMLSVKLGGENLYVYQPNNKTHRLVKSVKSSYQSPQWRLTVYDIGSETLSR